MKKNDQFIEDLTSNFKGFQVVRPSYQVAVYWTTASLALLTLVAYLTGPFRPAWLSQVFLSPRFAAEMATGVLTVFFTCWLCLATAIPGRKTKHIAFLSSLFGSAFLILNVYSLFEPATTVSMTGKRPHCLVEGFAVSIGLTIGLLLLVRRRAPEGLVLAGLLSGLASCLICATTMHLACMYDPVHIMKHHVGFPLIVSLIAGAGLGTVLLKKH